MQGGTSRIAGALRYAIAWEIKLRGAKDDVNVELEVGLQEAFVVVFDDDASDCLADLPGDAVGRRVAVGQYLTGPRRRETARRNGEWALAC